MAVYQDGHLVYDSDTGLFSRTRGQAPSNRPVSCGYTSVANAGRKMPGHRMAWLMVYGEVPEFIDHINGVRHDNRLANLRACSREENNRNVKVHADNVVGIKGVSERVHRHATKRWRARLMVHGRTYCTYHATQEEAAADYRRMAEEHHGDFARI